MKKHLMVSVAMSAIVAAVPALAQTTTGTPAASSTGTTTAAATTGASASTDNIEEIEVIGLKASLRDALATKREATGVVEVVSAKDIGVLPDVTIAETLNQIPGVNATRDRGNESQVAIGGLGPRLSLGLIDGREMASSEPDRNVRWEIFPSEIVSGIEVYKTSEADLPTGGIAGTVDIQTIRPLDYKGPEFTIRGGPVYYTGGSAYPDQNDLGSRFSGAWVDKLTPQLGIVVAATYQDQKNGYEDMLGSGNGNVWSAPYGGPIVAGGPTVATPGDFGYEGKAIDTKRGAVDGALQWKPNSTFEARVDALYSIENIDEHDQGEWVSGLGNWGGTETGKFSNTIVQNGAVVAGTVADPNGGDTYSEVAQYHQDMVLFATGVNAKWNLNDWQVVGDVAYSQAERASLWQAVRFQSPTGAISWNVAGAPPEFSVQTNPWQAAQNGTLTLHGATGAVSHLLDRLKSEKVDVLHDLDFGAITSLKMGIRATEREKDDAGAGGAGGPVSNAEATNQLPQPSPIAYASGAVPASWFTPFNYKTLVAPTMITGNYEQIVNAAYGAAGAAEDDPNMWDTPFTSHVTETTVDGYAMANYDTAVGDHALTGNFGVHVIHVSTNSESPEGTEGNSYTKALPSINAKLDLGGGNYLKGGIAEALSRPALNDLRSDTAISCSQGTCSGGGGNPKLMPYEADTFDISYENYFRKDGLFAVHPYSLLSG